MLYDSRETSYEPDMAELIDKEEEIVADEFGVDIETAFRIIAYRDRAVQTKQSSVFGQFISILLQSNNQPAVIYAFALAAGLDQLNGIKTETEVAKKLGCTRALISHYVIAARDLLSCQDYSFDVLKFRKRNETRQTYADNATSSFKAAKERAKQELRTKQKK